MRISETPLAQNPVWATHLRRAVQADLRLARQRKSHYVELGGWAISEAWRKTRVAIDIAAASYALCRPLGGAIGSCAATVRHYSAAILKRLGGADFAWGGCSLPSYFDPCFGCQMVLLRFDSLPPSACLVAAVQEAEMQLAAGPVIYWGSGLAGCG